MPPNIISHQNHHNSNSNSSVNSNHSSSNSCSQSTPGVPRFPMGWWNLFSVKKKKSSSLIILNLLYNKIDLKTITERLKARYYSHVYLFRADVMRLFSNCREQYSTDTEQYKCANQLQAYFEKKLVEAGFTQ